MLWSLLNRSGRYERENPEESSIHLDIKKLGRIGSVGHRITGRYPGAQSTVTTASVGSSSNVCIDATLARRLRSSQDNQRKESAVAFLEAAVAYFAKLGIRVERDIDGLVRATVQRRSAVEMPRPSSDLHQAVHSEDQRKSERFIQTALSANGPTPAPITTRISDRPSCSTGSTATIGIGHMVA